MVICQTPTLFRSVLGWEMQKLCILQEVKTFTIGSQSRTLTPIEIEGTKMSDNHSKEGKGAFVRIVEVVKGRKKVYYLVFLNKVGSLEPNHNTYMCGKGRGTPPLLYNYTR